MTTHEKTDHTAKTETEKDRFVLEARKELKDWGDRIDELKQKARHKKDDARQKLDHKLEDLALRRAALENRVEAASDHVAKGWEEVRDDLGSALKEFRATASSAIDALKN